MFVEIFIYVFAYLALGFCLFAGYLDFKQMTIPNYIPICIGMIFVAAFALQALSGYLFDHNIHVFSDIKSHLIAGGLTFAIGFALFALKVVGGGDAKLAAAIALWLGLPHISGFLIIMGFAGGLVGVFSLIFKKKKPFKDPSFSVWVSKTQNGESVVPYGIALAIGAAFGFYKGGFLALL